MTDRDDRELEELLRPIAHCADCGYEWPEDGARECPKCGSDEISTVFVVEDDD